MNKFFIRCFIVTFFLVGPNLVQAASLRFEPEVQRVHKKEQFFVDVFLDAQGASYNGVSTLVSFPNDIIDFVRMEDGGSIIPFWIEKKQETGTTLQLGGVIPHGFSGLINPFDSDNPLKGKVIRLVFEAKKTGAGALLFQGAQLTQNDGLGTLITPDSNTVTIMVDDVDVPKVYTPSDTIAPIVAAEVFYDSTVGGTHPILAVQALDKESGIARIDVQESGRDWVTVTTPYVLKHTVAGQSVSLKVFDMANNETVQTLIVQKSDTHQTLSIIFVIIFLSVGSIIAILIRRYEKK